MNAPHHHDTTDPTPSPAPDRTPRRRTRLLATTALAATLLTATATATSAAPDTWTDHWQDDPLFTVDTIDAGGSVEIFHLYATGRGVPGAQVFHAHYDSASEAPASGGSMVNNDGKWSWGASTRTPGLVSPGLNLIEFTQVKDGKIIGYAADAVWFQDRNTSPYDERNAPFTAQVETITPDDHGTYTITLTGTRDLGTFVEIKDTDGTLLATEPHPDPRPAPGPVPHEALTWTLTINDVPPGGHTWGARQYWYSSVPDQGYDITGTHLHIGLQNVPLAPTSALAATGLAAALTTTWLLRTRRHRHQNEHPTTTP
ncbi:hypothetical protein H1Q78_10510 [Cellulosimicrobium cellulans]|uniref:hypothetical protein n=1 Tax=Cellulosimicrobium cellulans TaxID=1710 RepID=UPI001EDB8928|nr:hypothetical protein [Cellulosimicrobium cellulans]UKJ62263.1 hypothetical protein H1Q78_10510 [Cellulosimicrobium cellulans]